MAFKLRSPAFAPGEIPIKHACDGSYVSPPLRDVGRVDREQEHVEHHSPAPGAPTPGASMQRTTSSGGP
jgi:hypothetical protein